jgi:hypothetical protein
MVLRTLALGLTVHAGMASAAPAPGAPEPLPEPPPASPATESPPPDPDDTGEVIEVMGEAPPPPGAVQLDAAEARNAPGAFGEPLRALALLPGVATSVAALGYPVIRGSLPGESRFELDGIELPMLYHFLIGTQVVHPALVGDLELRAGGHGAEQGRLLGGHVAMKPADEPREPRTELRATLVEVGALHARAGKRTSLFAAFRAGTLSAVKLIDSRADLHYIDQQLRVVHRLGDGDRLVVTGLGAFDYSHVAREPEIFLGFHRFEARWERVRPRFKLRAGIQTELDYAAVQEGAPPSDNNGDGFIMDGEAGPVPPRQSSRSAGLRPYGELSAEVASWLTLRGGVDARYRALRSGGEMLLDELHPDLAPARATDVAAAWLAGDLRLGRVTLTPGIRADTYHVATAMTSQRSGSVDARLAATMQLTPRVRAELAMGTHTAPPQLSLAAGSVVLGPLPSFDGVGATEGLSRGRQAEVGVRVALPGDFDARLGGYWRDIDHAIDFGMLDKNLAEVDRMPCEPTGEARYDYTDIGVRAVGLEAMVRRRLGHRVSGWASYTLSKIDRTTSSGRIAHDFDQRHTLNAAVQVTAGKWQLGAGLHLHTGRPAVYPRIGTCELPGIPDATYTDLVEDPTRLRRLPVTWRADLRAQRDFRFAGWNARLVIEMQNAALRPENLAWTLDEQNRLVPERFVIPLPMIGFEADL